jgi:hypothetical protein
MELKIKEGKLLLENENQMIDRRQAEAVLAALDYEQNSLNSMARYIYKKLGQDTKNRIELGQFVKHVKAIRNKNKAVRKEKAVTLPKDMPTTSFKGLGTIVNLDEEIKNFLVKLAKRKNQTLPQIVNQILSKFKTELEDKALDLADLN